MLVVNLFLPVIQIFCALHKKKEKNMKRKIKQDLLSLVLIWHGVFSTKKTS